MENGTKLQNYSQIQRKETMIRSLWPPVLKYLVSPKEKPPSLPQNCLPVTVFSSQTGPGNW